MALERVVYKCTKCGHVWISNAKPDENGRVTCPVSSERHKCKPIILDKIQIKNAGNKNDTEQFDG